MAALVIGHCPYCHIMYMSRKAAYGAQQLYSNVTNIKQVEIAVALKSPAGIRES
jgi:hypothetical protein